jgi:hypothetical protein
VLLHPFHEYVAAQRGSDPAALQSKTKRGWLHARVGKYAKCVRVAQEPARGCRFRQCKVLQGVDQE